jgi:sec-independent protein translocase protein TatC
MVDPQEAIEKARKAVTERAELPGMSLMEHLDELRKRIVHSAIYLAASASSLLRSSTSGCTASSRPRSPSSASSSTTPTPWTRSTSTCRSRSSAEPFWPRPSSSTRCGSSLRRALPEREALRRSLHGATVALFLAGAGLRLLLCSARRAQDPHRGSARSSTPWSPSRSTPASFSPSSSAWASALSCPSSSSSWPCSASSARAFLWKNIRYAILAVFIVAAIICPSPDPWTMCIYAVPMLALYLIGIGVAWWVHPSRAKKKAKEAAG